MSRGSVAVSAAFVRPGAVGGAEQSLYALLEGLGSVIAARHPVDVYAPAVFPRDAFAISDPTRFRIHRLPGWPRNRFALDSIAMLRARKHSAVLFPNYFTPPVRVSGRVVTVINDLQYLHYPENFSPIKRLWLRASHEATLRLADTTVAISEFVRQDIVRSYGSRFAQTTRVIPWPIHWRALDHVEEPAPDVVSRIGQAPFILSVSAQYRHKNLETLVRGFAVVAKTRKDIRLVLVGQTPDLLVGSRRAKPLSQLIAELGITDRVIETGFVTDGQVGWLYRRATAFAFPSVFEGQGRPAIEALGMGLPVLTTNRTAIPEMTRGLATYVEDPFDAAEMASWLGRMCDAPGDFAPPSAHVAQLREAFSPETAARAFSEVLFP
jgi:glycosyltransferase involved in cell wall biosynthesis